MGLGLFPEPSRELIVAMCRRFYPLRAKRKQFAITTEEQVAITGVVDVGRVVYPAPGGALPGSEGGE